ncbi:MAG TPA: sigma factor-like helix-turn-helix DNA-binding protein [Tepidisphaeraceae bacterium]|jgi:DNA-directed RNA polymerase specialized sigma24 family protein
MLWSLTDEDVRAAQAGDAAAIERVYAQTLPPCARIVTTLAGRADVAKKVNDALAAQSAGTFPRWRDADDANRWFMHHLILLKRRHAAKFDPSQDVLLAGVGGPDVVQYQAMIQALRKLTPQQQEAFLLTHAQRWNTRLCAVAMDCSNTAVETHLAGADRQIRALLGSNFEPLIGFLQQIHRTMPVDIPAPPMIIATRMKARRSWQALVTIGGPILLGTLIALLIAGVVLFFLHVET